MPPKALPGFRDFPPDDLALRTHIFTVWRRVAARFGFEEYDGPPLEPLDLYTAKSGDEIVGQLYNFVDKGDRAVALRPEMTPTLARMVAERANGLRKPIRWFSIPQLFRYERQQRGRLREHFQLNCDLIGEGSAGADAEVIALAIEMMRGFGLTERDVRVRVSDRRALIPLLQHGGVAESQLGDAFGVIDKLERGDRQAFASTLASRGLTSDAIDSVFAIARIRTRGALDAALASANVVNAELLATLDAIDAMGLTEWIDVDLGIVRGLAYYTGTVFELFDAQRSLRAICGGGRYDSLLANLGGTDLPALGFGMGDVVLGELLKERGLVPAREPAIDVYVAGVTADDLPHVLSLTRQLRDADVRTEYALAPTALGKQLKLADARGCRFAVVIGPDDRARGEVQLKDLRNQSQRAVPADAVVDAIRTRARGPGPTANAERPMPNDQRPTTNDQQ